LARPSPDRAWTRPDEYLAAMARKRSFRRSRGKKARTQPETPRALLSTAPFLILLALLAILGVAIMILAFPGNQPQPHAKPSAKAERGIAERGWFQEAQKEMHH
jgi:hypothetical protein